MMMPFFRFKKFFMGLFPASKRLAQSGNTTMAGIGVGLSFLLAGAFTVDFGSYYTSQNQMQTAAMAGALAGAQVLYTGNAPGNVTDAVTEAEASVDDNYVDSTKAVYLGYVDPANRTVDMSSFQTPTTNLAYYPSRGYNAVMVNVAKTRNSPSGGIPNFLGTLMGMNAMQAGASSVAMLDRNVNSVTGGLRPIYVCQAQYNQAIADGNLSNNLIRIYGKQFYIDGQTTISGCPTPGSGNWGFADLRDCNAGSVGASTIGEWFAKGYPGLVQSGQCYSTKPGNFLGSGPVSRAYPVSF
jgi:hypothetical protein